jgi:hypothetical protein
MCGPHATVVHPLTAGASLLAPQCREAADSFASGLNTILLASQTEVFGDLQYHAGPDDLIFVTNLGENAAFDREMLIASTSLRGLAHESQAPPIDAHKPLVQWVRRLQTKAWKHKHNPCTLSWQSIFHCWDLNRLNPVSSVEFPEYCIADILGEGQFVCTHLAEWLTDLRFASEPSPRSATQRKRKQQPEPSEMPHRKRRKVDRPLVEISQQDQVDATVNGVELLHSKWDRIHSIGLMLQGVPFLSPHVGWNSDKTPLADNWLTLRWYDAQGAIATEPIDIIAQLPLLVMTVQLLQRFGPRMRGNATVDLKLPLNGVSVPFELPETSRPKWQLKGRRGVVGTPVTPSQKPVRIPTHKYGTRARSKATAPLVNPFNDLFSKLSWREDHQKSEASIIALARERARQYLPNPEHVTDHLPAVKFAEDYEAFSTCHIRRHLNLDTQGARVPSIMVMQNLKPFDDVEPSDFTTLLWQAIRCE